MLLRGLAVAAAACAALVTAQAPPLIVPAPAPGEGPSSTERVPADVSLAFFEQPLCAGDDFTVITGPRERGDSPPRRRLVRRA